MLPITPSRFSHGPRKFLLQMDKCCACLLVLQVKSVGCWGLPPFPLGEEWTQSWFIFVIKPAWKWKSIYGWEAGAVIWILASKSKNCSWICTGSALCNRLLNYGVRRKALPFQQLLTGAAGAVFCMKPCVLGAIRASFLGQTSEEEEYLVWDVCRCAVITKLFLSNKTEAAWGNKKHEIIIQENFIGVFRVGMSDFEDHILGANCSSNGNVTCVFKLLCL